MDEENINVAIKSLKDTGRKDSKNVLKSIVLSDEYTTAENITAYFFTYLNVDDLYSKEEFYEFVNEVYYMLTTN